MILSIFCPINNWLLHKYVQFHIKLICCFESYIVKNERVKRRKTKQDKRKWGRPNYYVKLCNIFSMKSRNSSDVWQNREELWKSQNRAPCVLFAVILSVFWIILGWFTCLVCNNFPLTKNIGLSIDLYNYGLSPGVWALLGKAPRNSLSHPIGLPNQRFWQLSEEGIIFSTVIHLPQVSAHKTVRCVPHHHYKLMILCIHHSGFMSVCCNSFWSKSDSRQCNVRRGGKTWTNLSTSLLFYVCLLGNVIIKIKDLWSYAKWLKGIIWRM